MMSEPVAVFKLQHSADPIDQYIAEHSLRLTVEQKEIAEYTKALPGKDSWIYIH